MGPRGPWALGLRASRAGRAGPAGPAGQTTIRRRNYAAELISAVLKSSPEIEDAVIVFGILNAYVFAGKVLL